MKKIKAFTLAEATSVLVILGVIAAITIPTLIMRQKEVAERAKIKKAWEIYDSVITTMRADHPMMSKEAFTQWANQANCPNTVSYFKTVETDADNGCIFKTADDVWFNISDILHPIVSLGKINEQDEKNTFTFVVSYDPENLTFSVNNPTSQYLTNDEKTALKKLFDKLDEDVSIKEIASKWVNNVYSICYGWEYCDYFKNGYDNSGNRILLYEGCDENGNNCTGSQKYEYDSNGNNVAYYIDCDSSGNNCYRSTIYEYDSTGNRIAEYRSCDGNGNNCQASTKYDYNSNGDVIAYYLYCDGNGNNCSSPNYYKYDYDSNGNRIAEYSYCDVSRNNCGYSEKYAYDTNGNKTAYYFGCDGSGNNCNWAYRYDYDSNGNKIAEYRYCDDSGNNCAHSDRYNYDNNGNKISEYFNCDDRGNNCEYINKYEYDSNGNKIAYYEECDTSGDYCYDVHSYSYTEIK